MSEEQQSRVHRRLTLNSLSNVARFAFMIVIAFFLTPFIVRTLGDAVYGFWVLLTSFLGYASILEMGVQPAVVKLVGQYRAVDDYDRLEELVSAALVFFLAIGVFALLVCAFPLPWIVDRWVEGLHDKRIPDLIYWLIGIDAALMYLNYLLTGILYGCQRYHLRNVFEVVGWILNVVLIVLFLERGGLLALILAKIAMDVLILLLSAAAVPKVFPELRIGLTGLQRRSFRDLMSFGGRVFLSATTTRLAYHAQPLIISTSLNAAATGFYAIPLRLVDYVRQVSWSLTAAFMPMFSELDSRNDREMLRSIYLGYSRYFFTALLPLPILLFVYGPDFVHLWIGPDYASAGRVVLYFLSASVLIESFQPLIWRFFMGVGNLNLLVAVSAVVSALTIVGSILLVRPLGIDGVALSLLIGTVVSQSLFLGQAARYLEISWLTLILKVNGRSVLVGALVYAVARGIASVLGTSSYWWILAGVLVILAAHLALALVISISADEREWLVSRVRRTLRRR